MGIKFKEIHCCVKGYSEIRMIKTFFTFIFFRLYSFLKLLVELPTNLQLITTVQEWQC